SAATAIYLNMRQVVDDTEWDEVYLDEEAEPPFAPPQAPVPAVPPATPGTSLPMVPPAPAGGPPPPPPAPCMLEPRPPGGTCGSTAPWRSRLQSDDVFRKRQGSVCPAKCCSSPARGPTCPCPPWPPRPGSGATTASNSAPGATTLKSNRVCRTTPTAPPDSN